MRNDVRLGLVRFLVCAAAVMLLTGPAAAEWGKPKPSTEDWSWLEGTVWYVPTYNLPAIMTSPDTEAVIPLRDQTVYTIDGYANGYYWGIARAQFLGPDDPRKVPPDSDPACNRMAASVTPEGTLNVSFAPMESSSGERITGVGTMRRHRGSWAMELQMTTGDTVQVTHWAYMRACPKNRPCKLPAISATAQEFVEACRTSP
ncbi:hypothetical protein [Microbaculum marinum]|uniref:Uncharacterized protein n=1 Tax=Microbaculum marinum TaxID=1764581 RepID=A0AAW9RNJ9_9HYPH